MAEIQYPLATLVVLFYRHEQFVSDTVAGALSQTYPNLEIIFSDDNSPDNTFEVVQRAVKNYKGPHKIILNRNEKNMGLVPHINKALFELAHGDFFFLNGGDDISMPERVSSTMAYFMSDDSIMSVSGSYIIIDKNGKETGRRITCHDSILTINDAAYLSSTSFMTGSGPFAFRRKVLDVFGRLGNDCQTEDSVLRFRSILLGPVLRSSKVFLRYRHHGNNISNSIYNFKTNLIVSQYKRDLNVVRETMPPRMSGILEAKIRYYKSIRELQERYQNRSVLFRIPYKLHAYYVKFNYTRVLKKYGAI